MEGMGTDYSAITEVLYHNCGTINIPPNLKAMFCSPSSVMVTSLYSGGFRNFKTGGRGLGAV